MYGPAAFRQVEPERDLLWHFMRAIAEKPEFVPVVDMLAIGPETHDRVARCSLALYAATLDFCALHAVTGTHWLRLMAPRTPDAATPLRYFWQAIASLVPKIGFPVLPSADELEAWRRMPLPDWPEIYREAVKRDDEHDLSLSFSAGEEFKHYGDPLYHIRGGEAPEPRLMILANARLPDGGSRRCRNRRRPDCGAACARKRRSRRPSASISRARSSCRRSSTAISISTRRIGARRACPMSRDAACANASPPSESNAIASRSLSKRAPRRSSAALIANGTTRVRSHVDIDNDVGLANLEAVLRVREAYREWIDIQLVAFPQSGVTTEKGAPDLSPRRSWPAPT